MSPRASIVIRSHNDAQFAAQTVRAICAQGMSDFEILNFDNSSTDGTADIIRNAATVEVRTFNVPTEDYVPGKILNQAVSQSRGNVIVFNNADAIVKNNNWLENLIEPISKGVAQFCYARQIARPDAAEWVAIDYAKAFPKSGGTPCDKNFFSAASCAFSADVFKHAKFDETIKYSEDVEFAVRLAALGMRKAYVPEAVVEHSHNYTIAQIKRRFGGEGAADAQIYNTPQSKFEFVKHLCFAVAKDALFLLRNGRLFKLPECIHARAVQKYAYYAGRRDASK